MSSPFLPSTCRGKTGGFTLLEMMITLVVFVLLCSAIFGIVSSVLQSSAGLQDNQNRRDEVAALNEYLKTNLDKLPAQSMVISYRRGNGEGLKLSGIVFGGNAGATAIDAKRQANGYYMLRYGPLPMTGSPLSNGNVPMLPDALINGDDSTMEWRSLIHDVRYIEWKFKEMDSVSWLDEWTNAAVKANMLELSIELAGDLQPTVMDFWMPRISPATLVLPQQAQSTPPAANPTPAPTNGH